MEGPLRFIMVLTCISIYNWEITMAQENTTVDNTILIDVGRIPEDFIIEPNSIYFKLKRYIETIPEIEARNMTLQPFLLYFETDLDKHAVKEFDKVIQLIEAIQKNIPKCNPYVLVTVRCPFTNNFHDMLTDYFDPLLDQLSNHNSIIAGVSFEYTYLKEYCSSSSSARRFMNIMTVAKTYMKVRSYLYFENAPANMSTGYVVEHNQLLCSSHIESYSQASYLIINVKLNRYENFVTSYGIFNNYMKNVGMKLKNMQTSIKYQFKIVYFRVTLLREDEKLLVNNHEGSTMHTSTSDGVIHAGRFSAHKNLTRSTSSSLDVFDAKNDLGKNLTPYTENRYKDLLFKYIVQWNKDANEKRKEQMIVDYFDDFDEKRGGNGDDIIPYVRNILYDNFKSDILLRKAICAHLNTVKSSGFKTFILESGIFNKLTQNREKWHSTCYQSIFHPETTIYTTILSNNTFEERQIANAVGANLIVNSNDWLQRSDVNRKANALNRATQIITEIPHVLKNLSITCQVWFQFETYKHNFEVDGRPAVKIASEITSGCEPIWNASSSIIAFTKFDVRSWIQESGGLLMKLLDEFKVAREIITAQSPNKRVILTIQTRHSTERKFEWNRETLYCKPEVAVLWHGFEAILVWARINDVPIILAPFKKPAYYSNPIAWEQVVLVPEQLHELVEKFPVFVRRTYNHSRVFGDWDSHTFPCITKSSSALNSKFQQLKFSHGFSGITFNMNLRENRVKLTTKEVQTILCFCLGQFPKVEIRNLADGNLDILYKAMSDIEFNDHLSRNAIFKKKLYLELEVKQMDESSRKTLSKIVITLQNLGFTVSVHISSGKYEINTEGQVSDFLRNKLGKGVQIGLFINDCIEFANKTFSQINTDADFDSIQKKLLAEFDYIVCNTETELADNSNDKNVQQYLDSHYYLKTAFHLIFPYLKEINFRLNPIQDTSLGNSEKGLHFLADVNSYAQIYKTNFFLLSAVSPEKDLAGKLSWWEISNYTDLTYTNFFEEHESEYMKKAQWDPIMVWNKHDDDHHTMTDIGNSAELTWALTGMAVVSVLFVILAAVLTRKIRRHNKLLSDEEVQEFLEGKKYDNDDPSLTDVDGNAAIFEALGYKQEYEIDKNDINVDTKNVLGFGQFGVVCSGSIDNDHLSRSERIAVKMPRSGCTKETLKSMLSEVKVLCYVGEHVNVVRFIGCYTKEISRGVLWIITEQCVGGTLQSYLRKKKVNGNEQDILPDSVRLCREIGCGMEFIAKQKVVHGDLSARNVLLNKYNICKIGDFGLSRKLYEYQTYVKQNEGPMPWRWMAYESLKGMKFSTRSDVWSYGVTVWEIFTLGDLPYPGVAWNATFMEELHSGNRLSKPRYATENIYDTMIKCWKLREEDRPTFSDLVAYFGCFSTL